MKIFADYGPKSRSAGMASLWILGFFGRDIGMHIFPVRGARMWFYVSDPFMQGDVGDWCFGLGPLLLLAVGKCRL